MSKVVRIIVITYCCIFVVTCAQSLETSTVKIDLGTFNGYVKTIKPFGKDLRVRHFLGVPYAEPPVGELRFQKTKKLGPSNKEYDVIRRQPACISIAMSAGGKRKEGNVITNSEDCLYLNIFAPENNSKPLPVMIYFHGGGFVVGASDLYPGNILAGYGDVIVVTVNYRLNVWGFLSTGDEILPGNNGLWDQHTAIQWVHENIGAFGGDTELVTLFGCSAGGASVIYQSMYPENKGLFKRIIAMSGSITSPWSFNPNPLTVAKRFGKSVGCEQTTTDALVDCIRSKSTHELEAGLNKDAAFITFPMELVTVVDGEFIPETPTDLYHGTSDISIAYQNMFADIDFMTGVVANEGLMMLSQFVGVDDCEGFKSNRERFENKLLPEMVRVMFGDNAPSVVNDILVAEYTDWSDPDNDENTRDSFLKISSDYTFNIQVVEAARLHASTSGKNTYVYYVDAMPSEHMLPTPTWATKPNHVDDATFLFGYDNDDGYTSWTTPYSDTEPEKWELEMSKAVITMWTNFVKSGDPNNPVDIKPFINSSWPNYTEENEHDPNNPVDIKPFINSSWPNYTEENEQYLNISQTASVGQRLHSRACNLWQHVIPRVIEAVNKGREPAQEGYCDKDGYCEP